MRIKFSSNAVKLFVLCEYILFVSILMFVCSTNTSTPNTVSVIESEDLKPIKSSEPATLVIVPSVSIDTTITNDIGGTLYDKVFLFINKELQTGKYSFCRIFDYVPTDNDGAVHIVFDDKRYVCIYVKQYGDTEILYDTPLTDRLISGWEYN